MALYYLLLSRQAEGQYFSWNSVAGDNAGMSERRFYRSLIERADERFDRHLSRGREHVQDT